MLHNIIYITGVQMSVSRKATTDETLLRINTRSQSPSPPPCSKPSGECGWEPKTFMVPIPSKE